MRDARRGLVLAVVAASALMVTLRRMLSGLPALPIGPLQVSDGAAGGGSKEDKKKKSDGDDKKKKKGGDDKKKKKGGSGSGEGSDDKKAKKGK